MTAEQLIAQYTYWGEHPVYPLEDWRYEVMNNDTRAGYWPWVAGRIEQQAEDDYAEVIRGQTQSAGI